MRTNLSVLRRKLNEYHLADNKILLLLMIFVLLTIPLSVFVVLRQARYIPRAEFVSTSTLGTDFGRYAVLSANDGSFISVDNTENYNELENFTIEAYIKYEKEDGLTSYPILSKGFNPPNEKFTYFLEITPDGKLKFTYSIMYNGEWTPTEIVSNNTIDPGVWAHVAVVYRAVDSLISTQDDGTIKLYINGVKDKEEVVYAEESKKIGGNSNNKVYIGMDPTGYEHFNGMLDEVHFSSYPKYSGNDFNPPDPLSSNNNTLLLFNFNQTEGNPTGQSASGELTTTSKGVSYGLHSPLDEGASPSPGDVGRKAVLKLSPSSGEYSIDGYTLQTDIFLDTNGYEVDAVSVVLEFDKEKMQGIDILTPGDYYPYKVFSRYKNAKIDNETGRVQIDALIDPDAESGIGGKDPSYPENIYVASVKWKLIKEGGAQVKIKCELLDPDDPTVCDTSAKEGSLVSEFGVEGGSILTNVVNANYVLTSQPTETPTPSPEPTLEPTPITVPEGDFGQAIKLDRQGEGVRVDGDVVDTSWLTVEAWVKWDGIRASYDQYIVRKRETNDFPYNDTFSIFIDSSDDLNARVMTSSGTMVISTDNVLRDRKWHHLALVTDPENNAKKARFYVDGKFVGSQGYFSSLTYGDGDFLIGMGLTDNAGAYGTFYGEIDEVMISRYARYNSNFTPPTIPFSDNGFTLALYHFDGDVRDAIWTGNHGQIVGDLEFVPSTVAEGEPPTTGQVRLKLGLSACQAAGADLSRNAKIWVDGAENYATVALDSGGVTQMFPVNGATFNVTVMPEGYLPKMFSNLSASSAVLDLSDQPISAGNPDQITGEEGEVDPSQQSVNSFDLVKFLGDFGTNSRASDFDCSGKVNVLDFSSLIKNWGKTVSD